jgi:hypothetical protein
MRRRASFTAPIKSTRRNSGGDGRDHNPHGFTIWFAGGGVKPGTIIAGNADPREMENLYYYQK